MDPKKFLNVCAWLCRVSMRSKLCQLLLLICVASVGLNVFLIVFRDPNATASKRSAVLKTRSAPHPMTAEVQHPRNVALPRSGSSSRKQESPVSKSHKHKIPPASVPKFAKSVSKSPPFKVRQKSQVPKNASSTHVRMPKCPLNPPGLVGVTRLNVNATNSQKLRTLFPDMEKGGRTRPANCTARERLAVIMPYRNRYQHLHILLQNLIPFLRKQMADATIFIIEQAPPSTFNRGALLNIGFLEAQKTSKFDCFLFHDVDLIPVNDRNFYRCGKNPHHYASAINKNRFRLVYEQYFGGVVGFSRQQYIKVNGNSNLYFGWGGEDDDLSLRTTNKNYTLDRYDAATSRYLMIKHVRDEGNEKNFERRKIMKSASQRQDVEGLNTTKYKVNSIKLHHLYTWINVSLDMKEILDTAPDYTQRDMWRLLKEVRDGQIQR